MRVPRSVWEAFWGETDVMVGDCVITGDIDWDSEMTEGADACSGCSGGGDCAMADNLGLFCIGLLGPLAVTSVLVILLEGGLNA
jgi:hypothetical protein